ncbi:hypothetical protein HOLleu_44042 [Holothuria leucospilota]|uniref:Uncharacterized protein n=1 Tax=Holothuria leucospilota TaxID=206669 RepID=A0A9Q1BAP3_HOLLE|nr:hypothetical protein HOLleu_44042 [Holothuria leucospilota]
MLSDHKCRRSLWLMNYNFIFMAYQLNNLDQIWFIFKGQFRWEIHRLLLGEKQTYFDLPVGLNPQLLNLPVAKLYHFICYHLYLLRNSTTNLSFIFIVLFKIWPIYFFMKTCRNKFSRG